MAAPPPRSGGPRGGAAAVRCPRRPAGLGVSARTACWNRKHQPPRRRLSRRQRAARPLAQGRHGRNDGIMAYHSGRHFLQIPGPTNVPDRVLRAIAAPTIDHRGLEFAELSMRVLAGIRRLCGTARPVVLYPSSGTGAWEAALVNTLSPGDRVLAFETGHFATLWAEMARRLGLDVDLVPGDWRRGGAPGIGHEKLAADPGHRVKAVTVGHNETSTGAASRIPLIRAAMDSAGPPALLIVDTISSLGSVDYRHHQWRVDVTLWCSHKGVTRP